MSRFVFLLALLQCMLVAAGATCANFDDGVCASLPRTPRSGSAMMQMRSDKSQTSPHKRHKKHHSHQDPADSDGEYLSLTGRVDSVAQAIAKLEEKSGKGREELRSQLDVLKETTSGVSTNADEAKARMSAAEGALAALEDVVNQNSEAMRKELDALRSSFEGLGKTVGKRWSAMLQSWSNDGDARADELLARVTELEGKLNTLESESGTGRLELANDLEALTKQVADISAGGLGSVETTRTRVTSTEKEVSSLAGAVDAQGADLMTVVATLASKLHAMGSKVGVGMPAKAGAASASALLSHNKEMEDPAAAGGSPVDTKGMSLTSRIAQVEKRTQLLEGKSEGGRGEIKTKLDGLADNLAVLKDGGAKSVAHTLVRLESVDTEIETLKLAVEQQKADITKETASLQAMLDALSGKVGGA